MAAGLSVTAVGAAPDVNVEIVIRAQRGDREAFASLAVGARSRLRARAARILRDSDLAEDATQLALLTMWRQLPQLRDPARFDAWSHRLLVRSCYAESGRMRRATPPLPLPLSPSYSSEGSGDLGKVLDRDELERGFRRLSADHAAVVVLRYYDDMPLKSLASSLGVPAGTVRSRLHHALGGLRAAIEADARPPNRWQGAPSA